MKSELQTAADKLIRDIFGVQPGETVVLTADGKQNLIYKHAISTVSPAREVDLAEWEETL